MTGEGDDRERWNARHAEACVGGWQVRSWLVDHLELLQERLPGRALDVGCGRGREALYLAEHGFTVDAIDVSDVAVDAVRDSAGKRDLPVHARRADLSTGAALTGAQPYDVVTCFYFLQRPLLAQIAQALAPGGLVVFETFTRDHVDVLGRDMNVRFTLEHNELLRAFADLRVLRYREEVIGGGNPRAVASLLAQKV